MEEEMREICRVREAWGVGVAPCPAGVLGLGMWTVGDDKTWFWGDV